MRIIRLKLQPAVREVLEEITNRYSIEDTGFTEDLFSLFRFRGAGLPTDERLEQISEVYAKETKQFRGVVMMHMRKRRHTLTELSRLSLFKSLCIDSEDEPTVAVTRILQVFREFSRKRRQATCMSCHLRSKCDFGKQYGEVAADASRVIDPNYKTKVHEDCPDLPKIEASNQLYEELQKLKQMNPTTAQGQAMAKLTTGGEQFMEAVVKAAEAFEGDSSFSEERDGYQQEDDDLEDQAENANPNFDGAPAGKGNSGPGTHAGKHFAKVNEDFVRNLSAKSLQLFEMGRKLDEMLKAELGDKFKPTPEIANREQQKKIQESNEVTRVHSSQFALDDDHFDAKLVKRDMDVRTYEKPETKKHLLYVIIDESGSMNGAICDGNRYSFLTRMQVSNTLTGALCKRIGDDGGMMFVRYFSDNPGPMMQARKKNEFPVLLHDIINSDGNGGGTRIIRALQQAHADITTSADLISKAEILLVSDMDDSFSPQDIAWIQQNLAKTAVGNVPLNVLNVNAHGGSYGNAHDVLPKIANKYMQVNPKSLDLEGIVELVK